MRVVIQHFAYRPQDGNDGGDRSSQLEQLGMSGLPDLHDPVNDLRRQRRILRDNGSFRTIASLWQDSEYSMPIAPDASSFLVLDCQPAASHSSLPVTGHRLMPSLTGQATSSPAAQLPGTPGQGDDRRHYRIGIV